MKRLYILLLLSFILILPYACTSEERTTIHLSGVDYVEVKKGDYVGIETTEGNIIIPLNKKYTEVIAISENGSAPIFYFSAKNEGYLDCYFLDGEPILSESNQHFSGFSYVKIGRDDYWYILGTLNVDEETKLNGLWDNHGNQLLEPIYDEIECPFLNLHNNADNKTRQFRPYIVAHKKERCYVFNSSLDLVFSGEKGELLESSLSGFFGNEIGRNTEYIGLCLYSNPFSKHNGTVTMLDADGRVVFKNVRCGNDLEFYESYIEAYRSNGDVYHHTILDWNGKCYFEKDGYIDIYTDNSRYFVILYEDRGRGTYSAYNLRGERILVSNEELDYYYSDGSLALWNDEVGEKNYSASTFGFPNDYCKHPTKSKYNFFALSVDNKDDKVLGTTQSIRRGKSSSSTSISTYSNGADFGMPNTYDSGYTFNSGYSEPSNPTTNPRTITYEQVMDTCPDCHGYKKCTHCHGSGYVNHYGNEVSQCTWCRGTGDCLKCNGTGQVQVTKQVLH